MKKEILVEKQGKCERCGIRRVLRFHEKSGKYFCNNCFSHEIAKSFPEKIKFLEKYYKNLRKS
jgi:ribosomal protein S27AE